MPAVVRYVLVSDLIYVLFVTNLGYVVETEHFISNIFGWRCKIKDRYLFRFWL